MTNLLNKNINPSVTKTSSIKEVKKFYNLREIAIKFDIKYQVLQLKFMSLYYESLEKRNKYLKHFMISYNDNRPGIIMVSYDIVKLLIKRIYDIEKAYIALKFFNNRYSTKFIYDNFEKESTSVKTTEVPLNNIKFNIFNNNHVAITSTELSNQMGIEHYYVSCFIENLTQRQKKLYNIYFITYTNINGIKYKVYFIDYKLTNLILNEIRINNQKYKSIQKTKILIEFYSILY